MRARKIAIQFCLTLLSAFASAQTAIINKPMIDTVALNRWVEFGREVAITGDGKFFAYTTGVGYENNNTLVLQSLANERKIEFVGPANGFSFSGDSKQFIYFMNDTVFLWHLATQKASSFNNVQSYKLNHPNKGEWLVLQHVDPQDGLLLINLRTKRRLKFDAVEEYLFDNSGRVLLLKSTTETNTKLLTWVSLSNLSSTEVWNNKNDSRSDVSIGNCKINKAGTGFAFLTQAENSNKTVDARIWYYEQGMQRAVEKVNNQSAGIENDLLIDASRLDLSENGKYILFQLQRTEFRKLGPDAVKLVVWNYRDSVLQCTQKYNVGPKMYVAAVGVSDSKVIRVTYNSEIIQQGPLTGDYIVVTNDSAGDRFWRNGYRGMGISTDWIVSLKDGSRRQIPTSHGYHLFWFSPKGNYLVYYDSNDINRYFSYNVISGKVTCISQDIPGGWLGFKDYNSKNIPDTVRTVPCGIAGWEENDSSVLVYDDFDIWELSLSGNNYPINRTNGYGRANHIKFNVTFGDSWFQFKKNEPILLTAFATNTKYNGFFRLNANGNNPSMLTFGPWTLDVNCDKMLPLNDNSYKEGLGMKPLKAMGVSTWVVKKQTATDAPNFFVTHDLKKFKQLTYLNPQKSYNWLTVELVTWKQPDGTFAQGLLYKPENFDSTKRYPVLIHHYQKMSHLLYQFPVPQYMESNIDVAWFVSRGYLVFKPDIPFEYGNNETSALKTITTAVEWLASKPYVDAKKIGIEGHSFGGGINNYIITHSNLFAAAYTGAGLSDYISGGLAPSLGMEEMSRQVVSELRMGATIWQQPEKYLNSPVVHADRVTTPLLLMHNKQDGAMPWAQSFEFFTALRRLDKPVWMLEYEESDHVIMEKDLPDFTIRITQFFDHYLKGAPPPVWMTQGINASLKGIETGLSLDPANSCSPTCPVCNK